MSALGAEAAVGTSASKEEAEHVHGGSVGLADSSTGEGKGSIDTVDRQFSADLTLVKLGARSIMALRDIFKYPQTNRK